MPTSYCKWHRPCGMKINSVWKFENATVREFYEYENLCDYSKNEKWVRNSNEQVSEAEDQVKPDRHHTRVMRLFVWFSHRRRWQERRKNDRALKTNRFRSGVDEHGRLMAVNMVELPAFCWPGAKSREAFTDFIPAQTTGAQKRRHKVEDCTK